MYLFPPPGAICPYLLHLVQSSYIAKAITHSSSTSKIFPCQISQKKPLVDQLEDVVLDGEADDFAAGALGHADLEVLDKVYQVLVLVNLVVRVSNISIFFRYRKVSTLSFPVTRIRRSPEASWASRVESWWPLILKGRLCIAVRLSCPPTRQMQKYYCIHTVSFSRMAWTPSNF